MRSEVVCPELKLCEEVFLSRTAVPASRTPVFAHPPDVVFKSFEPAKNPNRNRRSAKNADHFFVETAFRLCKQFCVFQKIFSKLHVYTEELAPPWLTTVVLCSVCHRVSAFFSLPTPSAFFCSGHFFCSRCGFVGSGGIVSFGRSLIRSCHLCRG